MILHILIAMITGWLQRHQQQMIAYLLWVVKRVTSYGENALVGCCTIIIAPWHDMRPGVFTLWNANHERA